MYGWMYVYLCMYTCMYVSEPSFPYLLLESWPQDREGAGLHNPAESQFGRLVMANRKRTIRRVSFDTLNPGCFGFWIGGC